MGFPSRSEFIDRVARLVSGRFPLVRLERNDGEFRLRINGHWTSLENLYRLSAQQPESTEHHIERWVVELLRAAEGTPEQEIPFEKLKHRVLPMITADGPRDVCGLALLRQELVTGLMVAYGLDSDRTIAYVPQKVFKAWNISLDELHETAIANLIQRSQTLDAHAAQDESGRVNLILIQTMDGYDASRILLPSLHDRLSEHLSSPFLAGIPNRDILVCFRNEPETVERMKHQIAEDYRTMPHQVSDRLFLITPDGIAPYDDSL